MYHILPTESVVDRTLKNLLDRGITPYLVANRQAALHKLVSLVPRHSKIMNGSSTTLSEIGFNVYLKEHPHHWHNLHENILQEKDLSLQSDLRRLAVAQCDYFLGGINAITRDGILVAVDASGSRVGAYPYVAKNVILISSTQKIVPTLDDAFSRIREYVFPLENTRAQKAYGAGSTFGKWVIIEREIKPDRIQLILVNELLGF